MLTPRGEHSFPPCSHRGDVRWENQFRRNRNRQNFVVGSYFPCAFKSRKNPGQLFSVVTCCRIQTCGISMFPSVNPEGPKSLIFCLWISVQPEQKSPLTGAAK